MADRRMYMLVCGPRRSTKTIGITHLLAWKLWTLPDHAGLVLGRNISDNLHEGPWSDLVSYTLPIWMKAGFGMKWITEPKMDFSTHWNYFEVSNMHGGKSKVYLASLDIENEVEQKFKGKRFGWTYMTELSNFKYRRTFDVMRESTRIIGWKPEMHQIICDTNPSEEGEESWIWKLWYWQRTLDFDNLEDDEKEALSLNGLDPEQYQQSILGLKELQSQLSLHEFTLDDNIWMNDAEKRAQFAAYAHDQNTLLRYYYGRWVKATGEGLFKQVWKPQVHLIGEMPTPSEPNPQILVPEEDCMELGLGWDLGRINHAVVVVEKWKKLMDSGEIKYAFKVLDEYVRLGERILLATVVKDVESMMDYWEKRIGRKIAWRHWSDSSSFTTYDKMADSTEHIEVRKLSNRRIQLMSAQRVKGADSIDLRVDLIQKVLFEDRLVVSRSECPHVAAMFSSLRRNRRGLVDRASIHKHPFDAMSYYICMELFHELALPMNQPRTGPSVGPPVISVNV